MRKDILLSWFGIFGLLLCGCQSVGSGSIPMTAEFPETIDLEGTPIGKELMINFPMGIEWRDSCLFLIQPGGCTAKVIRASDASDVAVFGPTGRGPDEFLSPCWIRDEANDSTFTVLDVTQRKIGTYRTFRYGDSLRFEAVGRQIQPTTGDNMLYSRPLRMRNGYYVAQIVEGGEVQNDGFAVLDSTWQLVRTFCHPLPEGNSKNKSHFQGPLVSRGDTLFYAGLMMPYLAAYRISEDGEVTTLWEQFLTEPIYEVESTGFIRWAEDEHRVGIYDLRIVGDYLVALYSGKPYSYTIPMLPETLLVFDLEGRPVKKFQLPFEHGRFALTPDGKTMYTISFLDFRIIRYDLGAVL